ncbi:uncharacterized protein MELLADRAFT_60059 [Melampsora larici-populina 98AG31]|uniref:Uncharacterized protein n=1 Tax=Melampsora larici-populina (strain 98AG31 / pathotype 3-4-7) TaxID=747676 RepID=F4R8L6_MELLP|nr:uncharacterized protein MELLADRAFT_60059 [Melampsora larici-populina 98AG31]EGG11090.1 hypothetical protein MELLADRAFT_60059 [Melampsora larici-populina 98AG31]
MSPLSEEFLNFQSAFDSLREPEQKVEQESGQTPLPLQNVLSNSRVQFKPMLSDDLCTQVNLPRVGPKLRNKWVIWSLGPIILLCAWLMTQTTSTKRESSTTAETIFDVRSQLKGVSFGSSDGSHHANHHANSISITILDSIKDLQDHASLSPLDSSLPQEVSNVLESQPNVQNSTVTAKHLRDLTALIECVYDSLRQLDGRGATEIRVLMEEVSNSNYITMYGFVNS